MKTPGRFHRAVIVVVAAVFAAGSAGAVDYVWKNPGTSGAFETPANWTPSTGSPGAGDTATIPAGETEYTVNVNEALNVAVLTVGGTGTAVATVSFDNGLTTNRVSGAVSVLDRGRLTHKGPEATEAYKLILFAESLAVESGGTIDVENVGYRQGTAPAGLLTGTGHTGQGERATAGYGSIFTPQNHGSGANWWGANSGSGTVILNVTDTLRVDGTITASRNSANRNTQFGSAGSVWITAGTLAGGGTIKADTTHTADTQGVGTAGRIALYQRTATDWSAFTGTISANSQNRSAGGTIYRELPQEAPRGGVITVRSGNASFGVTFPLADDGDPLTCYARATVEVEYGWLVITNSAWSGGGKVVVGNLNLKNKNCKLDLRGSTVEVISQEFKYGEGWAEELDDAYSKLVTEAGGAVIWTVPCEPGDTITWRGTEDGRWLNARNWEPERAPNDTDVVVVPSDYVNAPVISSPFTANSMTVAAGAVLTLSGVSLTVTNDFTNLGTLVASGQDGLDLAGDGHQTVNLNGTACNAVRIAKSGGSVTFADGFTAQDLKCTTAVPIALAFAPGRTVAVTRELSLDGLQDAGDGTYSHLLTLQSSAPGAAWLPEAKWLFKVTGNQFVRGVRVSASNATGGDEIVAGDMSTDDGGNSGWYFEPGGLAFWAGGATGDFMAPENWFPAGAPAAHKTLRVVPEAGETCALTLAEGTPASIRGLTLGGFGGTVTFTANSPITVGDTVDVKDGATLVLNSAVEPNVVSNMFLVRRGAKVTHTGPRSDEKCKVNVRVLGNMTVESGGSVDVENVGYSSSCAPAGFLSGGGHTGMTKSQPSALGYGSIFTPTNHGSGASNPGSGTAILDVAGTLRVDGTITASRSSDNRNQTFGSAGSIWLTMGTLAGGGTIKADCSYANDSQSGGTAGRIALYQRTATNWDAFTGTISTKGQNLAAGGTIYRELPGEAPRGGVITVKSENTGYGVTFPLAADGDPLTCYAHARVEVENGWLSILNADWGENVGKVAVSNLNLKTASSKLNLYGSTVEVSSPEFKYGEGWADELEDAYSKLVIEEGGAVVWVVPFSPGDTITWRGTEDDRWFNAKNWDPERVPNDTDVVVVPSDYTTAPVIMVPFAANSMAIAEGAVLTLSGASVTVTNDFTNLGTLVASGLDGLDLAGDGHQTVNLNGTACNAVRIAKGGGSVTFADGFAAQDLKCATAAPLTLVFASGRTVAVTREFSLDGLQAAGGGTYGHLLTLQSSEPSAAWFLKVTGNQFVRGVSVGDSNATGGDEIVAGDMSTDLHGNSGWNFTPGGLAFWSGGATGDFMAPENWFPEGAPAAHKTLRVVPEAGETCALTLAENTPVSVRGLTLGGFGGTVTFTANSPITVGDTVDVKDGATLVLNSAVEPNVVSNMFLVRRGAKVTHTGPRSDEKCKVNVRVLGNMTVESGGSVDVENVGYSSSCAPAGYPSGGCHTGMMKSQPTAPGYGSIFTPTNHGSGASNPGSGTVILDVTGTLRVDGTITASRISGNRNQTYGAAGSVWITAGTLAGTGTIRADCTYALDSGSGGTGGRIALYQRAATDWSAFTGTISATGTNLAAGGTVYRELPQEAPRGGVVTVQGGNTSYGVTFPMEPDGPVRTAFKSVRLEVDGGLVSITNAHWTAGVPLKIADLNLKTSGSYIDLLGNRVRVMKLDHRDGKNWGAAKETLVREHGGTLEWALPGNMLIVK